MTTQITRESFIANLISVNSVKFCCRETRVTHRIIDQYTMLWYVESYLVRFLKHCNTRSEHSHCSVTFCWRDIINISTSGLIYNEHIDTWTFVHTLFIIPLFNYYSTWLFQTKYIVVSLTRGYICSWLIFEIKFQVGKK